MEHLLGKKVKILALGYDEEIGRVIQVGANLLKVALDENLSVWMFEREVEEVVDNA